jgi:hypothetical protein
MITLVVCSIGFLALGYVIGKNVGQSVGYLQGLKGEWNRDCKAIEPVTVKMAKYHCPEDIDAFIQEGIERAKNLSFKVTR